jgi:hypothetical protein
MKQMRGGGVVRAGLHNFLQQVSVSMKTNLTFCAA